MTDETAAFKQECEACKTETELDKVCQTYARLWIKDENLKEFMYNQRIRLLMNPKKSES